MTIDRHNRLRRAFLPCASLLLAAGPAWSDDLTACQQLPKPTVTVKLMDHNINLNTGYSYRQLTTLGGEKVRPGRQVLGLTRANSLAQFALNMPGYRDAAERYECASPQITLTLGFKEMTVYVGKEFPNGSCAYKEIFDHEMRHVKAYQEHVSKVEKTIQEDITRRFATGEFWRGPAGAGFARVSKELDERWLPYVNREFRKVDQAQALIDTPAEYARLSNACNGEIKKLTR